jgi:hypothetical protein
MFRKYLEEDIKDWELELVEAEKMNDAAYIKEINAKIEEIKLQDKPYEHIIIENEITINTLKKIARDSYFNLDRFAESGQPLENLDNGFVTPEWLTWVIKRVFSEKSNGSFPNSTSTMFGNRNKIRFIKSKLEELL